MSTKAKVLDHIKEIKAMYEAESLESLKSAAIILGIPNHENMDQEALVNALTQYELKTEVSESTKKDRKVSMEWLKNKYIPLFVSSLAVSMAIYAVSQGNTILLPIISVIMVVLVIIDLQKYKTWHERLQNSLGNILVAVYFTLINYPTFESLVLMIIALAGDLIIKYHEELSSILQRQPKTQEKE